MDNKAYLDSIAVKGASNKKEPILSAGMIKFIIAGLIAFILLLIVGSMLSAGNKKILDKYAQLSLRISALSDAQGPLNSYANKIKSSQLRSDNSTLYSTLLSTNTQISSLLPALGVNMENVSSSVKSDEDAIIKNYIASLDQAYLVGNFDRTYSTQTLYQIQILLALENDIRNQTDNASLAGVLDQSIKDLTTLETNYKNYVYEH